MLSACGGGTSKAPGHFSDVSSQQACNLLNGKTVGEAAMQATSVPMQAGTPAYCKVQGLISPSLRFELRLPERWNGKLHFWGGGGYNGFVQPLTGANANAQRPLVALKAGYATVSTDSGHQSASNRDASFALNDAHAAELFGSLAVPTVMSSVVKALAQAYGSTPSRSYFEGCSNGGREAMINAQRFPELFDGIIARAPAYPWAALMGHFHTNMLALSTPGAMFSPAKVSLLAGHVRAACDALDGVEDGVVSHTQACTAQLVNIQALRCKGGMEDGDSCLSDAQLAVVQEWTSDAQWPGTPGLRAAGWSLNGNEDGPSNWTTWLLGNGQVTQAIQYLYQDSTFKNYLAKNPGADSLRQGNWERDPDALKMLSRLNDATNPDLRPFLNRGGKFIMWHGTSDPAISKNLSLEYFRNMRNAVGTAQSDASTRLYLAPGVDHCNGGAGADSSDLLAALDRWVVQGAAPQTLLAEKLDGNGATVLARPLCAYPQYPRYVGPAADAAAARLASNYVCDRP